MGGKSPLSIDAILILPFLHEPFIREFDKSEKIVSGSEEFEPEVVDFMLSILALINVLLEFHASLADRVANRRKMEESGFVNTLDSISVTLNGYRDDEDVSIRRLVDDWNDTVQTYW